MSDEQAKDPVINCHTHIFTGDHVPALLARSVLRWPFYYLLNFRVIFNLFRRYYKKADKKRLDGTDNQKARQMYQMRQTLKRYFILDYLLTIVGIFLTIQAVDFLCHWIYPNQQAETSWIMRQLHQLHTFFYKYKILIETKNMSCYL